MMKNPASQLHESVCLLTHYMYFIGKVIKCERNEQFALCNQSIPLTYIIHYSIICKRER